MCGGCIAGYTIQFEAAQANRGASNISQQAAPAQASFGKQLEPKPSRKTKKQKTNKAISPSQSRQVSEERTGRKLDKAGRLAMNIQIMLKSKTSRLLCLNRANEKAFHMAVEQLGMRLDEFHIEEDGLYLEIRLNRDYGKDTNTVPPLVERPKLSKATATHPQAT